MRRWLVIALLSLLPLQFSWAAVASYCGHERGAQAQHFGHHEHQHHAGGDAGSGVDVDAAVDMNAGVDSAGDGSSSQPGKSLGSMDLDCGQCHGCCAGLPLPAGELQFSMPASQPATPVEGLARTRAQAPPERPQWASLA